MLANAKLPVTFWAEAVNTACYVQNRVLVNKSQNKTPYELFNGKFKEKGDEGYFIGYSMSSKAFRIFNKRTKRVEENLHVEFLENKAIEKGASPNWLFDIDSLNKSMNYVLVDAGTNSTNLSESSSSKPQDDCSTDVLKSSGNSNPTATLTNPPADQLETLTVETPIPTASSPVLTTCFTDSLKPSSDARHISKRATNQVETPSLDNILTLANRFEDILRVTTNSDESNGVEADNIWTLVDWPKAVRPIGTKWVLKNKKDEIGIFIKNKVRLVVQGHTQEEGIDYDEVFAPIARTKAIRLFLAYASFMGFTVYQMDVKSALLYGTIDEEVYVMQPPRFQDPEFPIKCIKWRKQCMDYIRLLEPVKRIFRYLKGHPKLGLWYPKESPFDLVAYSDSDYGGATQDHKSTTGRLSMPCEALSREISSSILLLSYPHVLLSILSMHVGEGSGTPTEPHHTPSPKAQQTSSTTHSLTTLPSVTTVPIPTVTLSNTPTLRQYTRRARMAQSSALSHVADEHASPLRDVSQDDAPIKGRNLDEGEVAAEIVSDDTEEMSSVLTSMDAAIVLVSGVAEVPTGSRSIPTAGPPATEVPTGSDVDPTAGPIFAIANVVTLYTNRKGKETIVESEPLKKKKIQEQVDIQIARQLEEEMERDAQRMNEQIARDAEIIRIHAEEELQRMIDGLDRSNETVAKYLQEYHQFASELPLERRIELISSKEEAERFKRKGRRFEQKSAKKLKTSEEVPEEVKSLDEVPKEKVKDMMQLDPIEEVYVEALD
nr:retrovirus-related Pol polyprotein from transposon TNT 1-94 [Tanacetum cinerariifolium]